MRKRTRLWIALGISAVALAGARLGLPVLAKAYVNGEIAAMGEYAGYVEDVDIALVRGAYTLTDVTVVKRGARSGTPPFLDLERMDISLEWRALLSGELVGEIVMDRPVANFVQAESDEQTQLGTGVNWPEQVRELFPFQFNRVEVTGGLATFRAPGIDARESLTLSGLEVVLLNLTNVESEDEDAFADLELEGRVMDNAPLSLSGRIDPNEELPTFDINLSLEGARLVDVNPWLREFLNVDAEQGTFAMYAELAAAEGRFEGYVKPVMEQPEVFRAGEAASGPFQKAWEALVGFATKILENRERQQVATQVPLSGELENPDAGTLAAIVNLLRNAFVAAFSRSLEGTVDLGNVDPEADGDASPESDGEASPEAD